MTQLPSKIEIVEVGPRDGLQNEQRHVPTELKLEFVSALADSGLRQIEVTSFVHPKAVPQLADAGTVVGGLQPRDEVTYSALVPNEHGLERAIDAGISRIAVFTAVSESFANKNINMTIAQSLDVFARVLEQARRHGVTARGYLSTCFVCPFEGDVDKQNVLMLTQQLLDLGVDQVSISDTIGAAAPRDVFDTVGYVLQHVAADRLALHFHDTYGMALANVLAGLQLGVATYDASTAGLGGCPFAPGAAGNLATEDLVYMLDRMNIACGVDFEKLVEAAQLMEAALGRTLQSRQLQRLRHC